MRIGTYRRVKRRLEKRYDEAPCIEDAGLAGEVGHLMQEGIARALKELEEIQMIDVTEAVNVTETNLVLGCVLHLAATG